MCIAGARPNFMKIKPVMDAAESIGLETRLIHTGQHYDPLMSDVFFEELGIRTPDHFLNVGSSSHATQTAAVMIALEPVVVEYAPDVVLVVGDVNSSMAAALVAAKLGIRVAHVEAGLRSRDWSMPEEINRVVTDRVSDYLFASSPDAVVNLMAEGYSGDRVHLVGNVMIDSLFANLARAKERPIVRELGFKSGGYGLVTLHRPANVDNPQILKKLVAVLGTIAIDCPLVWPVHPRTGFNLETINVPNNIHLIPPVGYLDCIALEAGSRIVLTDSGGIQEETTALGVACLTLRENTERPITVTEGTNLVVGRDPEKILVEARKVLEGEVKRRCPALWDGYAGQRIAEILANPPP
jgi:UDP-N-acetylglucosamine 2-epimerase (non-hydrolysing)